MQFSPKQVELPSHNSKLRRDSKRLMSICAKKTIPNSIYDVQSSQKSFERNFQKKGVEEKKENTLTVLGSPITDDTNIFIANFLGFIFLLLGIQPILVICAGFFAFFITHNNILLTIGFIIIASWLLSKYFKLFIKCAKNSYNFIRKVSVVKLDKRIHSLSQKQAREYVTLFSNVRKVAFFCFVCVWIFSLVFVNFSFSVFLFFFLICFFLISEERLNELQKVAKGQAKYNGQKANEENKGLL